MGRERMNHIRKRVKNALTCISDQMCRESAAENLEEKIFLPVSVIKWAEKVL